MVMVAERERGETRPQAKLRGGVEDEVAGRVRGVGEGTHTAG